MKPALPSFVIVLSMLVCTSSHSRAAEAAAAPAAAAPTASHINPDDMRQLKIGDAAPAFDLLGIDGKQHTLAEYAKPRVLMIAFLSNHCPTSQAIEVRLKQLLKEYRDKGLAVVAINPNDPKALRPDELGYSKYGDSFDEMKIYAKEQGWDFPYLYNGDTQKVAKAYGCLATPHVFLFDADRKLRYQGRFDDSRFADLATVKSSDARNAVEAMLAGTPVAVAETKPHGCSTKWTMKTDEVKVDDEKWEKGTVDVEMIDDAGVAALRKNDTNKFRLFNVWATWCAPCVAEFPELVKTSRKFGLRDFELITISLDEPANVGRAKAFLEKNNAILPSKLKASLEKEGRKTNAYLFSGSDSNALVQSLDAEWPGPVPHTILVAPGGKVVFRQTGMINGDELRDKILEVMGHYYLPEPQAK